MILIDGRSLNESTPRGVARYTLEIANELAARGIHVELISNKPISNQLLADSKFLKKTFVPTIIPGTLFILFLNFFLRDRGKKVFLGINHVVPLFWKEKIPVIHDFNWIRNPRSMTIVNLIATSISSILSLMLSKKIIFVSNFTLDEFKTIFPNFNQKKDIKIISPSFLKMDLVEPKKITNFLSFILAVGTIEPKKNYCELLRAFESVKKQGYGGKLLIISSKSWGSKSFFDQYQKSHYQNDIKIISNLTDEELVNFYINCDLFVMPSLYEGFGISALEAAFYNAKVICTSKSGAFNELYGYGNLFKFNPDHDQLDKIISEALITKKVNEKFFGKSWNESTNELLTFIKYDGKAE